MTKLNERNLIIKYLGIIVSICLCITGMERLGWVSEDSIVPFFFACLLFIISQRTEFIMEKRRFVCVFLTAFSFSLFT